VISTLGGKIMSNKNILFILTITLSLLLNSIEVFARAGGGGGSGGGGWGTIIALPFILIYLAFLHYKLNKKNKESRKLMEKIAKQESTWGRDFIKSRIEKVFLKVQEAWMECNQNIAKTYISQRLYDKHKLQTDAMLKKGHKNILENINLLETRVVEVADYKDDSKDRFWVYIKGSMIDYTINEKTGGIVSGNKSKKEEFTELWKFIRGQDYSWVLDEIDQKVQISDVDSFESFSEEIRLNNT
jgi:hypothetical protein